jgi:hypothetical protein
MLMRVRASKAKRYASASVCGSRDATAILMGRSIRPYVNVVTRSTSAGGCASPTHLPAM